MRCYTGVSLSPRKFKSEEQVSLFIRRLIGTICQLYMLFIYIYSNKIISVTCKKTVKVVSSIFSTLYVIYHTYRVNCFDVSGAGDRRISSVARTAIYVGDNNQILDLNCPSVTD